MQNTGIHFLEIHATGQATVHFDDQASLQAAGWDGTLGTLNGFAVEPTA